MYISLHDRDINISFDISLSSKLQKNDILKSGYNE